MKQTMTLEGVAKWVKDNKKPIIVLYAFNATGKTRLSVAFKELMRDKTTHLQTGIYYNAFSEDLFVWDNDIPHSEMDMKLRVVKSSLNRLHGDLNEEKIRALLFSYHVSYDFRFNWIGDDPQKGIDSIRFFRAEDPEKSIKISRGEERLFVWNFFLALFMEADGNLGKHQYFFIDDPVGSLDENNLFITAERLVELMVHNYKNSKIIVTTHHMGFFTTLQALMKNPDAGVLQYTEEKTEDGRKVQAKDPKYDIKFLERAGEQYVITGNGKGTLQYHLMLLQELDAVEEDDVQPLHFVELRQILELISSFQGRGGFGRALESAGVAEFDGTKVADRVNALSHQRVYERAVPVVNPKDRAMLKAVVNALKNTFKFSLEK